MSRSSFFGILIALASLHLRCYSFIMPYHVQPRASSSFSSIQRLYSYGERYSDSSEGAEAGTRLDTLRDKITNIAIIEQLLCGRRSSDDDNASIIVQLSFAGEGMIGDGEMDGESSQCLFLTPESSLIEEKTSTNTNTNIEMNMKCSQSLPIPLADSRTNRALKLLSFAYKRKPISKSLCLTLNPLLINRDGGLFDNLPWDKWSIDPLKRNNDAANNPIEKKFHLGKRDAYNRFMGKDWEGRSLSVGNLAARALYLLENDDDQDSDMDVDKDASKTEINESSMSAPAPAPADSFDQAATMSLAQRVLEIEIKECRMAVAEVEEQLAITQAKQGMYDLDSLTDGELILNFDILKSKMQDVENARESLNEREEALENLLNRKDENPEDSNGTSKPGSNFLTDFLSAIVDAQKSEAPYRGAIGYKPVIDSKEDVYKKSILPYSSPFELMNEIIEEQLNAEVVGVIIEDTSLFTGSTIFGGGIVLRRKGRKKKISLDGEELEFDDSDDNFGNLGIKKGEAIIVECDCDEAIGMALCLDLRISLDEAEWQKSQLNHVAIFQQKNVGTDKRSETSMNILPKLENEIESIIIASQGSGEQSQNTKIQKPRGEEDVAFFGSSQDDRPVFDTENPVNSMNQFDEMNDGDKAQLLLRLDSFKGELPRPRVLKNARLKSNGDDSAMDPLDELLLPLIDESVRRQVLVRTAEAKGDYEILDELDRVKSRRQIAKENYEIAKDEGKDDLADMWEKEAEFLGTLRADVTQDEGSYSTYMDRDEWYERTRQKISEKNKKRFGSLMDGIE